MGPVGQRMPEPSFRYDGRTMVRYQGHLQIELLLSFTSYPQSLSGEHIPEDSLPCQQVVEISENIMQLPESTPDISIEIVRYGLIRLESFLEDGDYMKMDSLQQNL